VCVRGSRIVSITGAYVQIEELPSFYDTRRLQQLASDTGTACSSATFAGPVPASGNDLTCYNRVVQLILSASAKIDAVCQQGKRYARADLETLVAAGGKSGALLKRIAADLVFGELAANRGYSGDTLHALAPRYAEALEQLRALYEGEQIFDMDSPKDAGIPHTTTIGLNRIASSEFIGLFGHWPDQPRRWY
jgi:hypothetical protein